MPSCRGLALYYQEPTKVHLRFSCQCGCAKATSTVPGLLIHSPPVLPKAPKLLPLPHSSLPSTLALGAACRLPGLLFVRVGFQFFSKGSRHGEGGWEHTLWGFCSVCTLCSYSQHTWEVDHFISYRGEKMKGPKGTAKFSKERHLIYHSCLLQFGSGQAAARCGDL